MPLCICRSVSYNISVCWPRLTSCQHLIAYGYGWYVNSSGILWYLYSCSVCLPLPSTSWVLRIFRISKRSTDDLNSTILAYPQRTLLSRRVLIMSVGLIQLNRYTHSMFEIPMLSFTIKFLLPTAVRFIILCRTLIRFNSDIHSGSGHKIDCCGLWCYGIVLYLNGDPEYIQG